MICPILCPECKIAMINSKTLDGKKSNQYLCKLCGKLYELKEEGVK